MRMFLFVPATIALFLLLSPEALAGVCGSRDGPGYRGPNGKCVGFQQLYRVCGNPPTTRCKAESGSKAPKQAKTQ